MTEPSYESARDELRAILTKLESGQTPLAESLSLWERGEELAKTCQRFLDGAEQKVQAAESAADVGPADLTMGS